MNLQALKQLNELYSKGGMEAFREEEEIVVGPVADRVYLTVGYAIDHDSIQILDIHADGEEVSVDSQMKTMILRALAKKISERGMF